jgi:cysteine-rich repeat protein
MRVAVVALVLIAGCAAARDAPPDAARSLPACVGASCPPARCGDGIVTAGEACDDGNSVDGDGCDSNCSVTACGNGIVTAGEDCDDANAEDDDLCSNSCLFIGPELLYYRFDETGASVTNLGSAPPSGTATATLSAAQGGQGVCGGAMLGGALDTHWVTQLSGWSWTISFWSSGMATQLGDAFGDPSAGALRCSTGGEAGAGNWLLRGPVGDVVVAGGASSSRTLTTFVFDAAASEIRGYLDGALVTTVAQHAARIEGTGAFQVGRYGDGPGLPAGAMLDDFRLYNRALTDGQVQHLFATSSVCH